MSEQGQQEELDRFIPSAAGAAWSVFALAAITFGMRTVARMRFTEADIGWEDIIISISWLLDVVRMVTFQLALSTTHKVDSANLRETMPAATFWSLFTDSWSFLSVTLPKVGVAFLLIRIFRPKPWVSTTIMSMALGLFVICIVGFIICFVQCTPVAGQWDPYRYPDVHCWSRNVQIGYALVGSSASACLDFLFAVYPGFVIWKLQMPLWKRLSTMAFMGLGIGSFALAVIKVYSNSTLLGNPSLTKVYKDALHIGLWNSIENDFILIAACMPSVPPFIIACRSFTQNYLSTSGVSRFKFKWPSLKTRSQDASLEEHDLGLAPNGQLPAVADQSIHIRYEFTLQQESFKTDGHEVVS
ncbi:MAG: hypothetical protein M1822_004618 [Bathelium mastoideum]|nr:MAG: hypothetical protein M1822_004618 [Bathelium mastoideum]